MNKMRKIDRMNLISKIGRELQSQMSYKDIDVYLQGFGIDSKKATSTINSKWVYVKELLASESDNTIIKIADELKIEHDYKNITPSDSVISETLTAVDSASIQTAWHKALERRLNDPEGAITSARTLLEAVCKHILDEEQIAYNDKDDLPKMYGLAAKQVNLSPSQHTEQLFKQILGGCHAVVEGLGALRNKLSDAHAGGKAAVHPLPRHAELAVNLAGTMATFILSTWEQKRKK
jgi:uncharacterized protein YfkK (UPF0435 family)